MCSVPRVRSVRRDGGARDGADRRRSEGPLRSLRRRDRSPRRAGVEIGEAVDRDRRGRTSSRAQPWTRAASSIDTREQASVPIWKREHFRTAERFGSRAESASVLVQIEIGHVLFGEAEVVRQLVVERARDLLISSCLVAREALEVALEEEDPGRRLDACRARRSLRCSAVPTNRPSSSGSSGGASSVRIASGTEGPRRRPAPRRGEL